MTDFASPATPTAVGPAYPGTAPRPPRVGIPVVAGVVALCMLGAIGFGFGVLFGGGRVSLGANTGTRAQRMSAQTIVQTLNSQAALYKLQHNDAPLDYVRYPNWEQLTQFSDVRGATSLTKNGLARYGPYLQQAPLNPLNQMRTVMVADALPAHGSAVPGGQAVGFVFCPSHNKFFVTDVSGTRVVDPMARDAGGNR